MTPMPGGRKHHREESQEQVAAAVDHPFRHRPGQEQRDHHQQREQSRRYRQPAPRHHPLASGEQRAEDDELKSDPEQGHEEAVYPSSTTFSPNSRSTAAISVSVTSTLSRCCR